MASDAQLAAGGETIELQQQVARLQALLEASRQVHGTIHEEEVLESVLRIVVRELEMAGAAFPESGLNYGDMPLRADRGGRRRATADLSIGRPRRQKDDGPGSCARRARGS